MSDGVKNIENFEHNLSVHLGTQNKIYKNRKFVETLGSDKISLIGIHAQLSNIAYCLQVQTVHLIEKENLIINKVPKD